jgi:transglutaminase-like putative cysteine protease
VTWRIRVEHHSRYEYANVVHSSYNEARITPMTTPSQLVLEAWVEVEPAHQPFRYLDYWGSVVHAFDVLQPHRDMEVVGRSVVETSAPASPGRHLSWEELEGEPVRDDFSELLAQTRQVPTDHRLLDVAQQLRAAHPPAVAGEAAMAWVRDQLAYVPGTTAVHTSAIEAWEGGEGVCQDFAHLALAVVRTMGIPARYCSGYLYPNADTGIGPTLEGQSHAWIEIWTGDWQALDPTVGEPVADDRHVLVARGRDYADVSPVKGIYHGGHTARLDVAVQLTRLA